MESVKEFKPEIKEEVASSQNKLPENFSKCKLIHVHILKFIYKENKPISFNEIFKKLKILGADRTIRTKIYDLEKWGFIEAIHTRVLIITPIIGKEKEIINMITAYYNKIGDTF